MKDNFTLDETVKYAEQITDLLKELKAYRRDESEKEFIKNRKTNKRAWILHNPIHGSCYWRVQCPVCRKIYEMPRSWGPWKGCPKCWIELDFKDTTKKKDKDDGSEE